MDLGGAWRAVEASDELRRVFADPDLDDSDWTELAVPGHWRSHPDFAGSDGPLLYRRRFETPAPNPADAEGAGRSWLRFDGLFYQGDVWLDRSYLGDTEGYFVPHTFEVTEALRARREHVVAVEVACARPADLTAKHNLTGVFQHWDGIDVDWNPGGIWRPARLEASGPVRLAALRVLCPEATAERAVLDIRAVLDSARAGVVTVETVVRSAAGAGTSAAAVATERRSHPLAAGANRVSWRVVVEQPQLWWPHALGDQPLYDVEVDVLAGEVSDRRQVGTGLRQMRMRNFIATVNGERLFLKGANLGPTRRALGEATPAEIEGDVVLARSAGLDLLRVHGHISRPELYEAADRLGVLLWQDLPLQWRYSGVLRQAVRQAREAVDLLGQHPAVALWCGHNEPVGAPLEAAAGTGRIPPRQVARFAAGQILPSWNKTVLDRSIRRTLDRADGSRPVIAHSGVLPHPAWGTDSHLYFGWYHGKVRDLDGALARWPALARFVSEFGAQAVPEHAEFCRPERWPDLDWARLGRAHALQKAIFDRHVPPASYPTFDGWRAATQAYQATVIRHHVETLRRLKYRPTGGFCQFCLADSQPAVSWSVLDHERAPKAGYQALVDACAPVIVVADPPAPSYVSGDSLSLEVHVVNDLRVALPAALLQASVSWPTGSRTWCFAGDIEPDSCARVGTLRVRLDTEPDAEPGPAGPAGGTLTVALDLRWPGGQAANSYTSMVRASRW